jgi:hypothetical protein
MRTVRGGSKQLSLEHESFEQPLSEAPSLMVRGLASRRKVNRFVDQ